MEEEQTTIFDSNFSDNFELCDNEFQVAEEKKKTIAIMNKIMSTLRMLTSPFCIARSHQNQNPQESKQEQHAEDDSKEPSNILTRAGPLISEANERLSYVASKITTNRAGKGEQKTLHLKR